MTRIIEEVTKTFIEFTNDSESYEKMSKEDKEFWDNYLVNIKAVEDESGKHWIEIDYLPTNAASNL